MGETATDGIENVTYPEFLAKAKERRHTGDTTLNAESSKNLGTSFAHYCSAQLVCAIGCHSNSKNQHLDSSINEIVSSKTITTDFCTVAAVLGYSIGVLESVNVGVLSIVDACLASLYSRIPNIFTKIDTSIVSSQNAANLTDAEDATRQIWEEFSNTGVVRHKNTGNFPVNVTRVLDLIISSGAYRQFITTERKTLMAQWLAVKYAAKIGESSLSSLRLKTTVEQLIYHLESHGQVVANALARCVECDSTLWESQNAQLGELGKLCLEDAEDSSKSPSDKLHLAYGRWMCTISSCLDLANSVVGGNPLTAELKALRSALTSLTCSNQVATLADNPWRSGCFVGLEDSLLEMVTNTCEKIKVKIPKGCIDIGPLECFRRKKIFSIVKDIFERHGAVEIETPVFETRDTIFNKYGEEQKLVYELKNQGGESLCLRYDLTVPLARHMATSKVSMLKRYQMQKVYRRDEPNIARGRYREFMQLDFDIVGTQGVDISNAMVMMCLHDLMSALAPFYSANSSSEAFVVRLSNRKILDGLLRHSGVPADMIKTVTSTIDKLDKVSWEEAHEELTERKGVASNIATKIGTWALKNGSIESIVTTLENNISMKEDESFQTALNEMRVLGDLLKAVGIYDSFVLDLSLARGLDYYTSIIFEISPLNCLDDGETVGSLGGGGRYDNLVGIFAKSSLPAVGFSIGIERILRLATQYESKRIDREDLCLGATVAICSAGAMFTKERLRIAASLRAANVSVDLYPNCNKNVRKQLQWVSENKMPVALIIGGEEVANNMIQLKSMSHGDRTTTVPNTAAAIIAAIKVITSRDEGST